ncbi:LysR family transcriptional regulator [Streptomyces sp. KL116D]|uniref:LysR family transcriptional regulator n=1 Tax=Streptomyces sp. KL116D TaxID=3045152 RepID=UPI003559310A
MYSVEHLRTFLAVAQLLSFTRAASQLGLAQPTVSQHVRKLEDAAGRPLLVRDTRSVALTDDGEAMADFARTIISAHERAVDYFTGSGLSGRLRFGVTDDIALTQVPTVLRDFRKLHPGIDLALTVAQGPALQRRIESGHLDIALVKAEPGEGKGRLVRRDRLIWASVPGIEVTPDRPVPLIVYQAPSLSRALAARALDAVGRRYRVTCTVQGVNGVLAAVRAGLGIAIFTHSLAPGDLAELPPGAGLPELGEIDQVLLTNPRARTEPVEALANAILSRANPMRGMGH